MLKKFISIRNVGNFRRCCAGGGDTELRKLTLFHGDNGRGKSTLCSILRSLRSNDVDLILERTTLDGDGAPHVHLRLDGANAEFKDGEWSANYAQLEIFDADFVNTNVFSGDAITHDHKRNLCAVVLGEEGVKLADMCVAFDLKEREAIKALAAAEGEIRKLINVKVMSIDHFIALAEDSGVDQKIKDRQAELQVIRDVGAIREKASLAKVPFAAMPENLATLLSRKLDGISDDAEARVRRHLASHVMGDAGQAWLSEGLGYVRNDQCPMCGQLLGSSPVIKPLREFFGEAYANFKRELSALDASVTAAGNNKAMVVIQRSLVGNVALWEFWRRYTRAKEPSLSFDNRVQPAAAALRRAIGPLLKQKLASPLESIEMTPGAAAAVGDWSKLCEEVAVYNAEVDAFNEAITEVKKRAESKNSTAIEQEIAAFEARKIRYTEAGKEAAKIYREATANKATIEGEKQAAKARLAEYNERVVDAYRESVNDMLERFGAAFRLSKVKIEYPGGKPRAGLRI